MVVKGKYSYIWIKSITTLKEIYTRELESSKGIDSASNSVELYVEDIYSMVVELMQQVSSQQSKNNEIIASREKLNNIANEQQKNTDKFKEDNEIIFGVNLFTKPDTIKKTYVPILEVICAMLDLEARTVILKYYDVLIDYIATGIIDIGWFFPLRISMQRKYQKSLLDQPIYLKMQLPLVMYLKID